MKVLIFGATGMIGQGTLRESLLDQRVDKVQVVLRTSTNIHHPKFAEILHDNMFDLSPLESQLMGFDACFFCLGVSSAGMKEDAYTHITYTMTKKIAEFLLRLNPGMVFLYISGAGSDRSEQGKVMWARVKGRTENMLLTLGFKKAYMLRPGIIQPLHGIKSRTKAYRYLYSVAKPIIELSRWLFPQYVTTTQELGCAMLNLADGFYPQEILESKDICRLGKSDNYDPDLK